MTRSMRDRIADDVRADVLCARIHPGVRLSELELAKRYGVSRGPIREALSQLVSEGLLIAKPNCGVTVAPAPRNEVRDLIIPIRRTVETYALRSYFDELSARDYRRWESLIRKMDEAAQADNVSEVVAFDLAFHRLLITRTGQPELLALWQAVVAQVRGHFGEKLLLRYRDQLHLVADHHRKLLAVFRKGQLKAAIAALEKHIS